MKKVEEVKSAIRKVRKRRKNTVEKGVTDVMRFWS